MLRLRLGLLQGFATNKHMEYGKYFLVEFKYVNDAYYKTAHNRSDFFALIKKFENTLPVHILGGMKFPMTGSSLIFNCEDQTIPQKFIDQDPLLKDKTAIEPKITQLDKTSTEKFNRLAAFYSAY